ncbi:two-component system response regulator RR class II (RRII)-CheY-OmpR [Synechococcus sp. RS9909]|uniref:response regulator transcription factor n=1 Tax=unclassified Synechococcus TaxID=2626047 RepID=UPI000068FC70|nr:MULTISPECIES: response regulator transcription factor [unclassified Synechococcus]EAQ68132.1 two component transcriptional regulator, winged helix family protein [Synechococcus sp. RS9917]QNI78709.1 two-component system response regulator RR class II (RRII)-CheY-OmpR [Synechococcus sp. RS9909]
MDHLLVVDDDPELLRFLLDDLQAEGLSCTGVLNGQEALMRLRQERFDLVVLDWGLPDFAGTEICQRLRRSGDQTPVLMLTARADTGDRVMALDMGADDHLSKPFEIAELHARVRALLRRGHYQQHRSDGDCLQLGDLTMALLTRQVRRGERTINLSQREFDLLAFLLRRAGEVIPRQEILDGVWGSPFVGDPNTLDVYVGYLRRKLESSDQPRLLHTVRGVGFMAREMAQQEPH